MFYFLEEKIDKSFERGNIWLARFYELLILLAILILFVPSLIYHTVKFRFFTRRYEEMVEEVAKLLFYTEGGASNEEEWESCHGIKRPLWKTDAPWDTNPDELTEWQRDDYRHQAKSVLMMLGYKK